MTGVAAGGMGDLFGSLEQVAMTRVATGLRSAVARSAAGSPTHDFAQQLLAQVEQSLTSGTPLASPSGSGVTAPGSDVDALWQQAQARALGSGTGPGDALLQALSARDDHAARTTSDPFGLMSPWQLPGSFGGGLAGW